MKICLYTMYFPPDFGSAPILTQELAPMFLAQHEYQVSIITTIPRQRSGSTFSGKLWHTEESDGFRTIRIWTNDTPHPMECLLAWFIYTVIAAWVTLIVEKSDVLFMRLSTPTLGIIAAIVLLLRKVHVVFSVQDIHPDLAIVSGILKNPLAELEIVGDGPDRAYIESLVAESQARISLTRWLPHPQVIQKMRECDVFLFTSLRDGGGAVVVEAMASGKPVVCMDLAGPGLHVTDECGIKIPPISPEQAARDISNTLEWLYLNPDLRLAMGAAARVRAKQVYHWDRLGERLREIYEQALDIPIVEGKAESNR